MIIDKKIINIRLNKEDVAIIRRAEDILSLINGEVEEDAEIRIDGVNWTPNYFEMAENVLHALAINGQENFSIS